MRPRIQAWPNRLSSDSPPAQARPLSLLSVVIPARDEEACICSTVEHLHLELRLHNVPHELVVVDDGSTDGTWKLLTDLQARLPELAPVKNEGLHGFGRAVICGLDHMKGDAAVIMMADESDDCRDVVRYWQELNRGWDCVFGSRFMKGGGVIDYPKIKLFINRLANFFLKTLFAIRLNDTTNAFKAYRREVIDGCRPLISPALQSHRGTAAQGHRARVSPGPSSPSPGATAAPGEAKLKLREMGSRYLFICLYVWLEKYFSRGDYRKPK